MNAHSVLRLTRPKRKANLPTTELNDHSSSGLESERSEHHGPSSRCPLSPGARPRAASDRDVRRPRPFRLSVPRWLPILGLALVIGLNVWATVGGGKLIQGGWVVPGSEEQQAAEVLTTRFGPTETTLLLIFEDPDGDAASPAFQATVRDSLADITDDPEVDRVVTYADAPAPALLSEDGASTLAVVYLNKDVEAAVEDSARLADAVNAPAGVEVQVTGVPQLYHEFNEKIEQDLVMAETISLPIALLILLAVFGTLVAAGLPLLIAAARHADRRSPSSPCWHR